MPANRKQKRRIKVLNFTTEKQTNPQSFTVKLYYKKIKP